MAVTATAAVVLAGAGDTAAAPGPKPPPFTVTPGMPPLPHDPTSPFPVLPAAQQAAIRAWMAQMEQDGRTFPADGPHAPASPEKPDPKINARRAYQVRVAGSTEYRLYTTVTDPKDGSELGMDADGVRPEDGAAIDAKYIGQQKSCKSPFRLDNEDGIFQFAYENTMTGESKKLEKYASALKDPRNKVNHLELITSDAKTSSYFQALMTAQKVTGRVRIEP
ncbi:restriction endonuclease fold toxin-2 domain-containing protein [Kitasatospora sp. NPDC059648]|uniref:restriction endonuclease fold toxin-2 domain-containing protein n=1 Tax=Kitasatospora sp. NPDC059648 TaxID=3346894 RepID=UPI003688B3ED